MKVVVPLAKNILALLEIITTASAIDAGIEKKIDGTTTLIISNKEMNVITKLVQALEDSNILLKESLKQLEMMQKIKKHDF